MKRKSNCFVPQAPLGTTGNQRLGQEHGLNFAAERSKDLSRSGSSPATATDIEGRQNHLVRNICKNIHAPAIFILAYIFLNTRIRYFIRSFSFKWTLTHVIRSHFNYFFNFSHTLSRLQPLFSF